MAESYEELLAEIEELRKGLAESQELLRAIKGGEVDALVISGSQGEQVFTLEGADRAYRILIEAMNDGAVTMTSDGTILYCNRHFADMTKSPLEKVIGSSIYRFIPQSDQASFRVLQEGLGRGELTLQAEDESIMPVYISINSIQLSESQEAFCVVFTDLTEQKRKEEIVAAEKLARSIIEQTAEAVIVCDERGKVIRFSNAVLRILGCDPSLQSFEDLFDLRIPVGKKLYPISSALGGDVLLQVEASLKRSDGMLFHLLLNAGPLKSTNGRIIGCVITLTDITERKLMEEEIKLEKLKAEDIAKNAERQAREMEAAFSSIADGVVIYDKSANIIYMNEAARKISRLTEEDYTRPFAERIKPIVSPNGEPFRCEELPFNRAIKGELVRDLEMDADHGSDKKFTILASAAPIYDNKGEIAGVVATMKDITERKRAEDALRQSQEKYRQLVEGSGSVILLADKDMRITFMNQYGLQFFGYSPEEIIGKRALGTIIPIKDDEGHDIAAMAEDLMHRPDSYPTNSHQNIRKDGRLVWMSWANKPIYDDQGNLVELLAIGNDLTKLKEAEEALHKSEQRFKDAIDSFPNVLVIYDSERRIRYINSKGLQIIGRSEQEVVGRRDEEIFPPELIDSYLPALKQAIEFRTPQMLERTRHASMGGQVIIINIIPLLDENGNVHQILGITHDITERKQMEEELRKAKDELDLRVQARTAELVKANLALIESEDRFRVGLKNSPIAVFNQDRDLRYTWVYNPTPGLSTDIILGKTDEDIFPPEDAAELTKIKRRVLERGIGERAEVRVTVNGVEVFGDLTVEPLRNATGEIEGITCATMDITYRKKAEEELRRSKEAAEAAVEAKAAFLANMSHELRTPLNAVIGFSSLLLADNLTQDQKEDIERIRKGGEALLSIISDILEFSRAEKEKITLEHQPLSLRRCIEESMDMVAVQADKKGLNLAYTVSYGTPDTIISDPGRLRQVLVNLLSNAVKFTDVGDISVSVSSKTLEGNKRQITFAAKDTGIGMPQDKMDRLFLPFTQLEYVISRKRDGAGLGLAISKKLVELMGGEIWAESDEGKGSTFRFTIQAETIPGKQLDLDEKDRVEYENLSAQKPLSILVAEDNPSNQRVLVEMLKRLGYRPDAVADGREVLQALQIRPYDLVFMDIQMPEMDGLTATREIRKLWPENGPKVVAITAFAMDGDREKCLEAGADDYIAKPVKVDDLAMLLRNITPPKNKI